MSGILLISLPPLFFDAESPSYTQSLPDEVSFAIQLTLRTSWPSKAEVIDGPLHPPDTSGASGDSILVLLLVWP